MTAFPGIRVTIICSFWIMSVCIAFGVGRLSIERRGEISIVAATNGESKIVIEQPIDAPDDANGFKYFPNNLRVDVSSGGLFNTESKDATDEQILVPDFSYEFKYFPNFPEFEKTQQMFNFAIAITR